MSKSKAMVYHTEVVVVGSGPGGATVARGLARAGKKVLIVERGRDWRTSPLYGTYPGAMLYTDRAALLFTREGLNIIRPLMAGGATSMYCGCAARPPAWWKAKSGIDLDRYVDAAIAELNLAPLPTELRGAASTRLAEAANELGYAWEPLLKFMNPARAQCSEFDCGAKCMLGCRCGAKWNAAEWVDEAVAAGAQFFTETQVQSILIENHQAVGVRARRGGRTLEIFAKTVVLAGGGIGTPLVLREAGLTRAGQGLAMDTTFIMYGVTRHPGNGHEPPMTYAYADDEHGYMLSSLIDPWLMYPLITAFKGWQYPLTWPRWGNTLGVMIKLKDHLSGGIESEHDIRKPLTPADEQQLGHALDVSRRILIKAGVDPESIFVTPMRGTHPCATVRIGDLLDANLQTEIDQLYVCDASAFPEALARPTVLTIIGLGQRLVEHLIKHT